MQAVLANAKSGRAALVQPFIQAVALSVSSQSPAHWRAVHLTALKTVSTELCEALPPSLQQDLLMVRAHSYIYLDVVPLMESPVDTNQQHAEGMVAHEI